MLSAKGYRSYHGRGKTGKVILITALCLLLLVAVSFLLLQRYAVYETDGSIRFDLPWKTNEAGDEPAPPSDGDTTVPEVIIEAPEPAPASVAGMLHAVELDEAILRDGAEDALAGLPEEVNAVAVRLKNEQGELLYASALEGALEAGAVKGEAASLDAIKTLDESGMYLAARISALHDSLYSFAHMKETGILQLKHRGYIWYAPDSSFYLAPEKAAAREYLVSIACECAELGFDELIFDSFGYPDRGRLSNIDESAREMSKSDALALLSTELRKATETYGVKLSVLLDPAVILAGGNEKSGQELAVLAASFDRVYAETTAEELPALAAALAPYSAELVPILKEPPADGSYLLAK